MSRACGLALLATGWNVLAAAEHRLTSPDGNVELRVTDGAELRYRVLYRGREIVAESRLGLVADGADIGLQVRFGAPSPTEHAGTYPLRSGHALATDRYRALVLPVASSNGESYEIDLRAYDDGAALRCRLPAKTGRWIERELSEWTLAGDPVVWFQKNLGNYEGLFERARLSEVKDRERIGLPVTVQFADGSCALLTEANLVDFGEIAVTMAAGATLRANLHADPEGWASSHAVVQPWRVTLVARDLNALVNSDLVRNLCPPPPPALTDAAWIKPGRAAWNWWSTPRPVLAEQLQWIDWARQLGYEYYLIDAGWQRWSDGARDAWACLRDVCAAARVAGVRLWIWTHSRTVTDPAARRSFFEQAKAAGVVGVKIDFVPKASHAWVTWYEETLREAAEFELMLNFHGANKPTGRDRTWPHELTREAIRGHEWHILRFKRTLPPEHDTILPFNRLVQGHGDYTPTVFDPAELRGYTWPRELAQAIVMTSPLLCLADHPSNLLGNELADVLKAVPATWDETVVLPGSEIGKCVAFARRSGNTWFVAVLNGAESTALDSPLNFLGDGQWRLTSLADHPDRDDGVVRSEKTVTAHDRLVLTIRPSGGFVGRLQLDGGNEERRSSR